MANQIVNAAPMTIDRGTQDLSTRLVPRTPEAIPQHLPKFFLFTEKGPSEPQLVVGAERDKVFGSKTFDPLGKYSNHSTVYANLANANANACMIQRVIPTDAGPEGNMILWLDVLESDVDTYARDASGKIILDALGLPTITGTIIGYKFKWVLTSNSTTVTAQAFGTLASMAGDQTGVITTLSATGTPVITPSQSIRYPIMEIKAANVGEYGNRIGIRLSAPTIDSLSQMPTKLMANEKVYPYHISVIKRPDLNTTPHLVKTLFGESFTTVTFKPDSFDPLTSKPLFIGDTFIDAYQNISDPRYAKVYGDFGTTFIYNNNISTILNNFHTKESLYLTAFSDITTNIDSKYLINLVSGVSSFNSPYESLQMVSDSNSVLFSEFTNVYAAGGSDGTINNTIHADLVTAEMARYLDANDSIQDIAVNVESIVYDTGFPLATKYALINAIGIRKDMFVVLGVHEVDSPILTASEEHSLAIALRTRLQSFPESDYFGTPVMRGMIVGRSGKIRNNVYTKNLPLTAEVLVKSAIYMGSSNGRWKNGSHFDGAPGSIIDSMYDINITWVPTDIRNRNWDVGLNWVQAYDRTSYFFPALKTIYNNDTSVLNSYLTALAIGQLNKISHSAWREFSGVAHLTNGQLVSRVNDFVSNAVKDIFDGRFVIQPNAYFSDLDITRGYSWTLPIRIYAANMKTVMTTYVQAYRLDTLQP